MNSYLPSSKHCSRNLSFFSFCFNFHCLSFSCFLFFHFPTFVSPFSFWLAFVWFPFPCILIFPLFLCQVFFSDFLFPLPLFFIFYLIYFFLFLFFLFRFSFSFPFSCFCFPFLYPTLFNPFPFSSLLSYQEHMWINLAVRHYNCTELNIFLTSKCTIW